MECYLNLLPPELKSYLVKFCDGSTIISLGLVSASWREAVLSLGQEEWWKICLKEIAVDYRLDIVQSLYPKLWFNDIVYWSDIYVSWNKWRRLLSPNSLLLNILCCYHTYYEITSVKLSGCWLFIGTREGQLVGLNLNNGEKIIKNQCGHIFDMELRCNSKEEKRGKFEACEHDELILRTPHQYVIYDLRTDNMKSYGKLPDFFQLKSFGDREIKIFNIYHRTEVTSSSIVENESTNITLYDVMTSVLQVWNNKVLAWCDNGKFQVYNYNFSPLSHEINDIKIPYKDLCHKRIIVAHLDVIFILHDGTSSNVLGKSFIIMVGNQKKTYYPLPELGAEITGVMYHAACLFLGTSDGFLCIFEVSSDKELLNLNLGEPKYKLNVTNDCTLPIVYFSIQENCDSHFWLAAASINSVYLISTEEFSEVNINFQNVSVV